MNEEQLIQRRGIFIISVQLDGLCQSFRLLAQVNAPVSTEMIVITRKLYFDFRSILVSGKTIEGLPEPNNEMSIHGLLTLAEVLRASTMSFLSSDEAEEISRSIGFKTSNN